MIGTQLSPVNHKNDLTGTTFALWYYTTEANMIIIIFMIMLLVLLAVPLYCYYMVISQVDT